MLCLWAVDTADWLMHHPPSSSMPSCTPEAGEQRPLCQTSCGRVLHVTDGNLGKVIWMGPSTVAENFGSSSCNEGSSVWIPVSWVLSARQVVSFFLPNNPVEELGISLAVEGKERRAWDLPGNSQAPGLSHERSGRPGRGLVVGTRWCSHENHCGFYALGTQKPQRMSEWIHNNYWGLDKNVLRGTSLVVQWLRLHVPMQRVQAPGAVPGQRAKIPHASRPKTQNITQKHCCNKFNKDFKNGPHLKKIKEKNVLRDVNRSCGCLGNPTSSHYRNLPGRGKGETSEQTPKNLNWFRKFWNSRENPSLTKMKFLSLGWTGIWEGTWDVTET